MFTPFPHKCAPPNPLSGCSGAEQVFFELPKLSTELLSSVNTIQQHGRAVLSFKSLELAHQATYTCHAVSVKKGIQKTRRFELVVFPDESKEEEVKDKEERMRVREGEELAEWEARNMWQKVEEEEEGGEKEGEEGEREGGEGFLEEEKQPDAGNPADSKFSVPVFETMEDRAKVSYNNTSHNLSVLYNSFFTSRCSTREKRWMNFAHDLVWTTSSTNCLLHHHARSGDKTKSTPTIDTFSLTRNTRSSSALCPRSAAPISSWWCL